MSYVVDVGDLRWLTCDLKWPAADFGFALTGLVCNICDSGVARGVLGVT